MQGRWREGTGLGRWLSYGLSGIVLALGSPLGWMGLRALSGRPEQALWRDWLGGEVAYNGGLYLYLWIGTSVVFASFGVAMGVLHDRLGERFSNLQIVEEAFRNLSMKDSLTGLGNYRGFISRIHQELGAGAGWLSLLMLDLDHLKEINDRRGHVAGDVAIQKTAHAIQASIRLEDYAARYGGDEFVVLLHRADLNHAREVAARIHAELKDHGSGEERLTVSIGVASVIISKELSPKEIFRRVDQALYSAKKGGRDQTCIY